MPGTIQVSVLELLNLPSSSISIKVSMGMKEHQVSDKGGEFLFPLTTLRDNLIVALYDIEGNELSRTGMSTKLVVEKGIWEDLFALEGGGQLHLKLQFILSEKERKRIRDMRETALKKKQEELLINGTRFPEMAAVTKVALDVVPAFNNEVTDTRNIGGRSPQGGAISSSISPVASPDLGRVKTEEVPLGNVSPTTDERKRSPAKAETSQDYEGGRLVGASLQIVRTTDSQTLPDGVPAELISSERAFEYLKTPIKNGTDETKGISSVSMPSQEHKSFLHTEAAQQIPVKINTQSPPNDINTLLNSSQNQTQITIKQVPLKKIPRTNETDRDESSSEATKQMSVNTTIKQIAPVKTSRDNEIGREEISSEEPQQILVKIDPQSLPNDITTGITTLHNQDHGSTERIVLEKTSRNNGADGEEMSSVLTQRVPAEFGSPEPTYHSTAFNSQPQNTIKQIALVKFPENNGTDRKDRKDASSVTQIFEEQKLSGHTGKTLPLTEKTDIQPPPNAVSTKFVSSKKDLEKSKFIFGGKIVLASSPLIESQTHGSENHTALKSPMNVRKLISALESSQPQGLAPHVNAPKLKFHLSSVKSEGSLKRTGTNEANMHYREATKQDLVRESIPFPVMSPSEVTVQESVSHSRKVDTEVSSERPSINEVKKASTESKKLTTKEALNSFSLGNSLESTVHPNAKNVKSQKWFNLDAHVIEASDSLSIPETIKQLGVLNKNPVPIAGTNSIKQADSKVQQKDENNNIHEDPLEDSAITCEAETATISGRIKGPLFREHIHTMQQSSRMVDAIPAAVEGINTSEQVGCNLQHKEESRNRQEAFSEEFVVLSEAETATTSGRLREDPVWKVHTHGVHHGRQGSFLNVLDDNGQRTNGDQSDEIRTSLVKQKSVEYLGIVQPYTEAMGNWILPDERSMCITTGSKQTMDFMESFETSRHRNQRDTSPHRGFKKVDSDSDTFVKEKETEMSSDNLRNSKLDTSKDDTVPGRLIGQAAKIVIAVAVGTLVVILRGK